MQIATIAMEEAEIREPDATRDSEQPTLPSQGEVIESACELFAPEESEDDKGNDIMQIIGLCLKDAKKYNTKHAIKSLSHLVAVSEYVQLQAQYWKTKATKWPCLSASIAIARRMGKGPYFACQIRPNELHHSPPSLTLAVSLCGKIKGFDRCALQRKR